LGIGRKKRASFIHKKSWVWPGKIPYKVGLTGGIGSGKSLALKYLGKKGIPVLQSDVVGHELLHQKPILQKLLKSFGKTILEKNGKINRWALAQMVFQDPAKQKKIGLLLHPAIREEVSRWVKAQAARSPKPSLVVVEVPLLFERGYYRWFDGTISISALSRLRQERLLKRGWNLSEIRRREKFQWSQKRKDRMADWVIFNQTTPKDLKYALDRWTQKLQAFLLG